MSRQLTQKEVKETKTYLILKYGSVLEAHLRWTSGQCFSKEDEEIILGYFSYHLNYNKKVDKRKKVC